MPKGIKHLTKKWKENIGRANSIALMGKHCSPRTEFKKGHKLNEGKNNPMFGKRGQLCPNYINGNSRLPYPLQFSDDLKLKIRKRDNYTCQKCAITEKKHLIIYGTVLEVHHIDYDKQNLDLKNLISLCKTCNIKANKDRDYWFAYFMYIIKEKIKNVTKIK